MDLRAVVMGLAFAVMWSSAFTSARVIVQYASPLSALCLRFAISGVIGVMIARALGQSWHMSRAQWRLLLVFGIFQNALYLGLNFIAMQWIEASLAAIIASTMPLIVALGGWALGQERLAPLGIAGLLAGIIGVAVIMGARLTQGGDLLGIGICVVAVLSLAVATMAVRGVSSGDNVLMMVGLQMLVGAVALAVAAALFEQVTVTWTWQLGVSFVYTLLVPGLLATWVWFLLVARVGPVRAAVFHFLTPFFGVAIAALLLGEALSLYDVIGVTVIALGIWAVQSARQI